MILIVEVFRSRISPQKHSSELTVLRVEDVKKTGLNLLQKLLFRGEIDLPILGEKRCCSL